MNSEPLLVTAAVVMKPEGTLLLARRPVGDKLAGRWELPGRKVEAGESPGGCLAPELREECGIEVVVGQHLCESTQRYPHATIRPLALLVNGRSGELVLHAHDDHRWLSLSGVKPFPSLRAEVQP